MDQQRVNLDGFAHEDVGLGLLAMDSPHDPRPSLRVEGARVVEMDSRPGADVAAPRPLTPDPACSPWTVRMIPARRCESRARASSRWTRGPSPTSTPWTR